MSQVPKNIQYFNTSVVEKNQYMLVMYVLNHRMLVLCWFMLVRPVYDQHMTSIPKNIPNQHVLFFFNNTGNKTMY